MFITGYIIQRGVKPMEKYPTNTGVSSIWTHNLEFCIAVLNLLPHQNYVSSLYPERVMSLLILLILQNNITNIYNIFHIRHGHWQWCRDLMATFISNANEMPLYAIVGPWGIPRYDPCIFVALPPPTLFPDTGVAYHGDIYLFVILH